MNFSQAVKGQLKPSQAILAINSQAETELRRSLNKDEETFLFKKFNPHILLEQIQKVIMLCYNVNSVLYCIFIIVWIWIPEVPSILDEKT